MAQVLVGAAPEPGRARRASASRAGSRRSRRRRRRRASSLPWRGRCARHRRGAGGVTRAAHRRSTRASAAEPRRAARPAGSCGARRPPSNSSSRGTRASPASAASAAASRAASRRASQRNPAMRRARVALDEHGVAGMHEPRRAEGVTLQVVCRHASDAGSRRYNSRRMPSVIQPAEFFVVGGPVQPERPCYVERAADLSSPKRCAPSACAACSARSRIGKSSLLQRAARDAARCGHARRDGRSRPIAEQAASAQAPDGSASRRRRAHRHGARARCRRRRLVGRTERAARTGSSSSSGRSS